jgi:ankyrin repeat protein
MADKNKKPNDNQDPGEPDNRDGMEKALDFLSDGFNRLTKIKLTPKSVRQNDFFRAVKNNDVAAVLKMLDSGFDPNSYNGSGQTAMHVAVLGNAAGVAQALIDRGANLLLGTQDNPEHTPLEDAVNFNKPEMVELLARQGGYVPGAMINGWSLLHRACEKGKTRIVEALLKAGANCNEMTGNGSTPLLIAVKLGQADVIGALLQFQAVVEAMNEHFVKTDERKRTAFQLAVDRGQMPVIISMIGKGANVNSKDATEKTPLLCAIENGNIALVRLLVENGADLNKPCATYGTPLVHACVAGTIDDNVRAEMIDLLIRMGADTEIPSPNGRLPLHLVLTMLSSQEVLAALLRYPLNKEVFDGFGVTPLIYAAMFPPPDSVRRLLAAGADPNGRSREDASTPLIHAVKCNNVAGIQVLLQSGANPKLYDGYGKSALSYAREKGYSEIIAVLERALQESRVNKTSASPPQKP